MHRFHINWDTSASIKWVTYCKPPQFNKREGLNFIKLKELSEFYTLISDVCLTIDGEKFMTLTENWHEFDIWSSQLCKMWELSLSN